MNKILSSIIVLLIGCKISFSQVTVTNPTNTTPNLAATYTSLANAITALNGITAISGSVTITLLAGNAQTAPIGGYAIQFTATTTVVNTITIQGNNNTITAFTPQAAGSLNDAVFKIIGADYVTITDFTIQENAAKTTNVAATNNMTEFGIALLRASNTNGAQHNTINNNTISLNRNYRNTFGIYSNVRHTATDVLLPSEIIASSGSNSGNIIIANVITNVDFGVVLVGAATLAYMDEENQIGEVNAADGNTITNWGGNSNSLSSYVDVTTDSYAIFSNHQVNDKIFYNTITSAVINGASFNIGGILKDYSSGQPNVANTLFSIINQNTIRITSQNANGDVYGILSKGINTLCDNASLIMDSNKIIDCSLTTTNSSFNGIVNNSSFSYLAITQNIIAGLITNTTTGGYVGIANNATIIEQVLISFNRIGIETIGAATFTQATTGTIEAIKNANILNSLRVESNTIEGFSVVKTGVQKFINCNVNQPSGINIDNNHLGSASQPLITTTGFQVDSVYGILCSNDTAYSGVQIYQNTFYGFVNSNTAQCDFEFITHKGNTVGLFITENNFNNLLINTTKNVTFIRNEGIVFDSTSTYIIANATLNTFNKTGNTGDVVFISNQSSAALLDVDVNFLYNKFNNVSVDGSSNVYFIKKADTTKVSSKINYASRYNSFTNINVNTGTVYGYTIAGCKFISYYLDTVSNINTNGNFFGFYSGVQNNSDMVRYDDCTISNISSTVNNGVLNGFFSNAVHIDIKFIYACSIDNIFSSGINTNVNGIAIDSGEQVLIIKNKINNLIGSGGGNSLINGMTFDNISQLQLGENELHTLSQTGIINAANTGVNGILTKENEGLLCYNNTIANLLATQANLTNAINGIKLMGTLPFSNNWLYHNTVSLNASSTGANFGTSGLYHVSSNTITTANLSLINNLISNTSTSNGSGTTVTLKRSSVDLDNYNIDCNNNLFYAGIPSPSNLIYFDGVNSDQTIANFKIRVSTRDTKSISLLPIFVSTTDLHLTDANCGIDGKGAGGFLSLDLDGQLRDNEAPDIGADEFTSNASTTLAGVVGTTVCDDRILSSTLSTLFKTENCNPIATIEATGGSPIAGQVNMCVYIDPTVVPTYNTEPYVQRHIDVLPSTATSSTTGTITLYFTNDEFENFNANNVLWPDLPTVAGGGNADPNKSNLRVTQYHGVPLTSPSSPNQYDIGTAVQINPDDANIIWNGDYWEVKFDVTGFSGFYVHTNLRFVLPVSIKNLTGVKQGEKINLNWKVTCNNSGKTTLILERSTTGTSDFVGIKNIQVIPAECSQLFSHSDFNAFVGSNYYRVKIIDEYGNVGYSNTILVLNANTGFEITNVFPNPINGNVQAKMGVSNAQAGILYFTIFDMQGRIVKSFNKILSRGYNIVNINLSDVKSGSYIIKANEIKGIPKQIKIIKI